MTTAAEAALAVERSANPPNPKQRYGDMKPNLALVPGPALAYAALAMMEGARKYGAYNWRDKAVEATTYVAACERHLRAWFDGEELDPGSGNPHLGHAVACLAILIDAIETPGCLIDNRPKAGATSALFEKWGLVIKARAASLPSRLASEPKPFPVETFGPHRPWSSPLG